MLVRQQRQLARVGDVVRDRLVKGMRSEYHSITDTWDVHNISMDTVKRDLRQKGMRIKSRAQSHTTEPPTPMAFATSHDDATTELLKR
jgi:pyruvoyl-dependent arginine decarboxylase (PvlArgDC)